MSDVAGGYHPVSDMEFDALWRAAGASHVLGSKADMETWRLREPWSVRMSDAGEAIMLQRWRDHLDVLQIRKAWCSPKRTAAMLEDVRRVAAEQGFSTLLSPLLDEGTVKPYVDAGLSATIGLIAYTFGPVALRRCAPPRGVELRLGTDADVDGVAALEAACFSPFWRHSRGEVERHFRAGRMLVAEENARVVGYTLTTLNGGSATLARVAVHPEARRRGLGRALVAEASEHARQAGASAVTLCTQEKNDASRALYASLELVELHGRLVLAADPSVRF